MCSAHGCQVDSGPWEAVPDTTTPAPPSARMEALARVIRHSQAVLRINPGAHCTRLVSATCMVHVPLAAARLAGMAATRGRAGGTGACSRALRLRLRLRLLRWQAVRPNSVQSSLKGQQYGGCARQRADACAGSRMSRSCGLCAHSAADLCEARPMR